MEVVLHRIWMRAGDRQFRQQRKETC